MPNEKEFYQAEVLVFEKVPLSYITNINSFKPKQTLYTGTHSSYTPPVEVADIHTNHRILHIHRHQIQVVQRAIDLPIVDVWFR